MTDEINALITEAKLKNPEAMERLIKFYEPFINSVVNKFVSKYGTKHLTDDLKQDARILFTELVDNFDPEKSMFGYYLKHNFSKFFAQRHFKNYPTKTEISIDLIGQVRAPDIFSRIDLINDISHHVSNLPPKQKASIQLYYIMEFSQKKCAEYLHMEQSAFSRLLSRARENLKKKLLM